ncbi:MAG: YbaK/EbsC family protein, partial [Acidobacteria bacterium]|nr:YbaK/EbsC family protein [Acidobacteriota bacterium]
MERQKAPYQHQVHRTAYTSQEVAAEEHIPGKMVAKSVVIKIDNAFALAVLPAPARVDVSALKASLRAKELRLATEFEFTGLFSDCEVGAMPPFGNLYGLPVYVEQSLTQDEEIVFYA